MLLTHLHDNFFCEKRKPLTNYSFVRRKYFLNP